MSEATAQDGAREPEKQPPLLVQVTWTSEALDAMKALEASGDLGGDASTARRKWNAALKKAARECVASVRPRGAAQRWAEQHESATWSLDATFVCDAEMRELNARFRHKDRPTDVLSFSQAESAPLEPEPLDSELGALEESGEAAEVEWPGAGGIGGGEAALGDLVIAVETTQRQARERAHAGEVEVLFLSIHGTLHLLGYDHQTSAQRVAMWREQEALFDRLRAGVEAGRRRK